MNAASLQFCDSNLAPCFRLHLPFGTVVAATFGCPLLLFHDFVLHSPLCPAGSDLRVLVQPLQETSLLP
jgi:hypothetical protein